MIIFNRSTSLGSHFFCIRWGSGRRHTGDHTQVMAGFPPFFKNCHQWVHQDSPAYIKFPNLLLFLLQLLFIFPAPVAAINPRYPCPDGCFCDNIDELVDCSGRGRQALTTTLPPNTRVILFQNNEFQWISFGNFNISNLRRVRKLSLADNQITGITQGTFAGLQQIAHLDLSGNFLYRIPHDIRLLKSLNELYLDNNAIRFFSTRDLHNNSRLEVLSLAHNKLEFLDSRTLSMLKYLQVFSLRNNSISNISAGAFSRTTFLEELDLSSNRLGEGVSNVSDWFQSENSCSHLKKLLLGDNMFQEFTPDSFLLFAPLRILEIQTNQITQLTNNVFQNLQSLEILSANSNNLQSLPLQLFKQVDNLHTIDLSNNQISDVPSGVFSTNFALEIIKLTGNQMEDVTWLLHTSSRVRELYLSSNLIADIPDNTLIFFPYLETLQLDNNLLIKFPRLGNMTMLAELNLAGNRISYVPEGMRFHSFRELRVLSVASNSLTTLDEAVFTSLPAVEEFQVHDNPYKCDCHIKWLDEMYFTVIPPALELWLPTSYESMECNRPLAWRGRYVADVSGMRGSNLRCSSFADAKGITGLVLGWLILLFTFVIVYWRWKIKTAKRSMKAWKPKNQKLRRGTPQ